MSQATVMSKTKPRWQSPPFVIFGVCIVIALLLVAVFVVRPYQKRHALTDALNSAAHNSGSLNCAAMTDDIKNVIKNTSSKETIGQQYFNQATCYAMKSDHTHAVASYKSAKTYLQGVSTTNAKNMIDNINVNLGLSKPSFNPKASEADSAPVL